MSIINSLIIAESDDFVEQEILYDGMFSSSSIVTQSDTQIKFVKKKIADLNPLITSEQLISFCTKLTELQYHFYLPFSYISLDNQPALYTTYIPNQSLQDVINQQMKEVFNEIDSTQEYLILYGISVYLEELHNSQKVHGRIKLTNILLDQNFSPLISDSFLYEITNRHLNSEVPNKTLDYIISLSPEALKDQPLTMYSDIYSFAIVILQVLRRKINIYSNISNDPVEIEKYILNDGKPLISEQYILNDEKQSNFYKILEKCFSSKQDERPSASQLKAALEQILISKKYSKRFEQFKNSIEHSKIDANKEIIELKERAEKGNLDDIYSYGYILLTGEKCTKNELEGMNYIRYAAKKGFSPAQSTYNIFRKDVSNPASSPLIEEEPKNKMQVFLHLKDDPFFTEKDAKIEEIIEKVKHNYNETQKNNIDKTKIQQFDFIPTEKALERLMKLLYYIESNVPVILEGPTGTSKTLSVEIICNYTKRKMIRFNLSSETKIADFLGKYINDSNSWAGIQTVPGPFIDAYEKGYTLLLDEMNLASPDCLQFIEDALDSGVISVEVSNMPLREIKMHKDFRLIATQNPNKDFYVHKRKDFTKKFLSRFQVINFPEFEDDELLEIAIELAKKNNFNDIDLIKDLVKFHIDCKSLTENDNDIRCYTVREIAATVKALSKKENIYDTIMTIYGARYQKEKKNEIEKMLRKYPNFKDCKPSDNFCYPRGFPECFHNDSLSNVMRSVKFSFDNHRPVILIGSEGSGLTQVAYWIAERHNLYGRFSKIEAKFLFMCTEETKNSDLIGQYKPSNHLNSSDISNIEPIEWANGLLPNAVENGFCIVLDNIDQAPTTVSERINGLLDKKFDDKDKENYVFEIPENPKKPKIPINQDFRLICTCKKDNLNQMSPAFINRFDVIFLEDQTTKDETQFKLLISILMKQTYLINELYQPNQNEYSNMNQNSENTDTDSDSDSDSNDFCFKKNMKEDKKEEKEENKIDKNLINILYDKIKDMKITMFKLSQLCRAVLKYYYYFPKEIEKETIINFSIDLLINTEKDFNIPPKIEKFLIDNLKDIQDTRDENKFFFINSNNLKSFIAKLFASSLINLPVCVIGPTGVGKTSAARKFSQIKPNNVNSKGGFQMYSFHSGTKPKDFYGTITIKDEKVYFINGTLTTSMSEGQVFIADEMNLSSLSTMKALAPALEPINGKFIYISGVDEPILVNPGFFFIACQNDIGTKGRNAIPLSIESRFRYFYYPEQSLKDIKSICFDIGHSFYQDEIPSFTKKDSEQTGEFIIELNKLKRFTQLSFRDITKLFRRIYNQDHNKERFKNINFYQNLLFYILASVNHEDINEASSTAIDLIVKVFKLKVEDKNKLIKSYNADPSIEEIDNKCFLKKGEMRILFESYIKIDKRLKSLLNAMFQILLSDPSEPVLLIGPSGFKTFISKIVLNEAQIITLNQESSVSQILGSSAFLSKNEAKIFYIENICKICHQYDKIREFKQKLNKNTLSKEEFEEVINPCIKKVPTFEYAINHLKEKLFEENKDDSYNCILSNLTLEFRPGLLLSAILERKSLILKNIFNIKTIVLERFNEFLSGKHNLTLHEDIHNTFTSKDQKEMKNINSNVRIISTGLPNSSTNFSEAALSRFTIIYTKSYESIEQKIALQSYINTNNLIFDELLIPLILDFAQKMDLNLNKEFTFPQIINSIEMCSRLNTSMKNPDCKKNLGIILYRLGYGLLEKRKKTFDSFIKIFNDLGFVLSNNIKPKENFDINDLKSPLVVEKLNGYNGLKSLITEFFIKSSDAKYIDKPLAFNPMFSEMLDILHLGILTNTPVIFEGMPGQGKQTAINYIAELLGFQITNIIISRSTKVEDFLGKTIIDHDEKNDIRVKIVETKLVEIIKNHSMSQKTIIVFHNINHASSAVLEVLVSIFDKHQESLLLQDGSTIPKGKLNLVGIFNPQKGYYSREKLPSSLIFSSIYHIVNNPKENDIFSVIVKLFEGTKFEMEIDRFYERFIITKNEAKESNSHPLTLNDIVKYKIFREVTYDEIDENFISMMIFAYRFVNENDISNVREKIGLTKSKFNPIFIYNLEKKKLLIKVSENSENCITLKLSSTAIDVESIYSEIASLTIPQKHCLLFLACCVLSKQSCIIQGDTASGKSHIIRLFSRMLGKDINVYQMNCDTGISILTGQSVLSNSLSPQDIQTLNLALSCLEIIPEVKNYISLNIDHDSKKWKREMFSNLIKYLGIIESNQKTEYLKIREARQKIFETIQPAKRFHVEKSSIIKAITKGKLILIDGIESAQAEITEKISSLCGLNPELDIHEYGKGHYYTRNNVPNSKPIHDDFLLLITHNPISPIESKTLDPVFLNKCATFTLPPIDSTPEYSAQVIIGKILNKYHEKFSSEFARRLAIMHSFAKKLSEDYPEYFAGSLSLTGRTIKNVFNEFLRNYPDSNDPVDDAFKHIIQSMLLYYWNSYIKEDKQNFKKQIVDQFSNTIDEKLFTYLFYKGLNLKDKYKDILNDLRNIQISVSNDSNESINFDFKKFVENCQRVQIIHITFIQSHVRDTINIINDLDYKNTHFDKEIIQLSIFENILNGIVKGMVSLKDENCIFSIDNENLLKTEDLVQPLSKFNLLIKLLMNDSLLFPSNIPRVLFNEKFNNLMELVIKMTREENLYNFIDFISILHSNPSFIPLIESRIPYNLFINSPNKSISYLMPMFRELNDSNITFHVEIMNQSFDFIYGNQSEFVPIYVFKESKDLSLSPSTQIVIHKRTDIILQFPSYLNDKNININSFFYGLTVHLIKKKNIKFINHDLKQFGNVQNPRMNQISTFSLLFSEEKSNKTPIISKIWSLLFSFSDTFIEIFANYLSPFESEILQIFSQFYNSIDKDNIEQINQFSNWFHKFNIEKSYLWQIKNNTFAFNKNLSQSDAENILKDIDSEINNLNHVPEYICDVWPKERYYNLVFEKAFQPIQRLIDDIKAKEENSMLKEELKSIFKDIEKIETKNDEYKSLKNQLMQQIRNDSKTNLTEEKIAIYRHNVGNFKTSIENSEMHYAKNDIMWPIYKESIETHNDMLKDYDLYLNIVQFSEIKSIIEKITNSDNDNVFQNILKLQRFPNMESIIEILMNNFLQDDNEKNIDRIYCILNANFIINLIENDLDDEISHLDSLFNKLENRKAIYSKTIMTWIQKNANQYPIDFDISLPNFKPKDLFFLLDYLDPTSSYSYEKSNFKNSIKKEMSKDFAHSIQCSSIIAQNYYKYFVEEKCVFPEDYSKLKDLMQKIPNKSNRQKVIKIMSIAEEIDSLGQFKFTFNDTGFLKDNWKDDQKLIESYPSLVFWIYKNQNCYKQLQNKFKGREFNSDKLPFWLFTLRLVSSYSCITFECSSNTETAISLRHNINLTIREVIQNKIDNDELVGTEWLNILLSNVSEDIIIQNYRMFYQFFINITEDRITLPKYILEKKNAEMKNFISQVFSRLFNGSLSSVNKLNINSDDDIITFIKDPNKYIGLKVKNEINDLIQEFVKSDNVKDLIKFTEFMQKEFIDESVNNKTKILIQMIKEETKIKEENFEKARITKRNNELKLIKDNLISVIENYNITLLNLRNPVIYNDFAELQKNCENLFKFKKQLPDCFDKNYEPLEILEYNYKTGYTYYSYYYYKYCNYIHGKIHFPNDDSPNEIIIYENTFYYFLPEQITEQKKSVLTKYPIKKILFHPFSQSFDIDKYCNTILHDTDERAPNLVFGLYLDSDRFINKMKKTTKNSLILVKELFNDLEHFEKNKIDDRVFTIPNEISREIKDLINDLSVQFEDETNCQSITEFLDDIKKTYTQFLTHIEDIDYMLKQKIQILWKASYNKYQLIPFFDEKYELPIPKICEIKCNENLFDKMNKSNLFSTPILSNDNKSLLCNYKKISLRIGPIIPSLYSDKVILNFISFIDKSFSMKITTNQNYFSKFSYPTKFSKGDSVQIYISLPEVTSDHEEIHDIDANINFKSNGLNDLNIKCNFNIIVLPLSFLISCTEYPLSYKDNSFHVCASSIISHTKLTFTIQNYFLDNVKFKYQVSSLDGNKSPKPFISLNHNKLIVNVPDVKESKKLFCEIKLFFSNRCSTSIIIKSDIVPYTFYLEVYDPNLKQYVTESKVYYSEGVQQHDTKLHFKLHSPYMIDNLQGEIENKLPSQNIKFFNITKFFKVKQDMEFDVSFEVLINHNSRNRNFNSNYLFGININGTKKCVNFSFEKVPRKIVEKNKINKKCIFNDIIYGYNKNSKNWNKLRPDSNLNDYFCFATPFSYEIYKQASIKYIDDLCEINNADKNIFVSINLNGEYKESSELDKEFSFKHLYKKIFKNSSIFYPIFGYIENDWYPFSCFYPILPWNQLEFEEKNIEIAKRDIDEFARKQLKKLNKNAKYLYNLLQNGNVIKGIKRYIHRIPSGEKIFKDVIENADKIDDVDNEKMIILKHNAIALFFSTFNKKFNEISQNKFELACILPLSEIKKQVQLSYDKYIQIDACAIKSYDSNLDEIKKDINTKEQHYTYLYTEKLGPKFIDDMKKPNSLSYSRKKSKSDMIVNSEMSTSSEMSNIQIQLPNLNIKKQPETISEINEIYLNSTQGTRLLPIFVSIMKSNESKEKKKEAVNYFKQLLQLYINLPKKDFSFISQTTNMFSELFVSMIGKFKNAGVDFTGILPSKCIIADETIQDFQIMPKPSEINAPSDKWDLDDIKTNPGPIRPIVIKPVRPSPLPTPKQTDPKPIQNQPRVNLVTPIKRGQQMKTRFALIVNQRQKQIQSENDKKKKLQNNNQTNNNPENPKSKKISPDCICYVNPKEIQPNEVTPKQFDGIVSEFTEENGIKRAINRIEQMKSDTNPVLNLYGENKLYHLKSKTLLKIKETKLPIIRLMHAGLYLANKFIVASSNIEFPRSKLAVNILVDCSSFISDENKIFNMMIICGLTQALDSLEIPYSVAVIADQKFKCIIKSFSDQHSPYFLQKICDCLLIKRYRTKLASSIKFAIESMEYKAEGKDNERPYRGIFVFSDGLDEQLVLTNAWSENILVYDKDSLDNKIPFDEKYSFGFVFIKSSKLIGDDLLSVENVWNKFEKEVNESKSRPIIKVAPIKFEIKSDFNEEVSDELVKLFVRVIERKEIQKETKNQSNYKYEIANFNCDKPLTNISRYINFLKYDYHEIKEYFAKTTSVLKNVKTSIDKLNSKLYQKKLNKISKNLLDPSLSKDQYFNLLKQFRISRRNIDQQSLETIFKPNKASQMVLSTTGTEFDITALVLNLINPVPDPMIYLEEKGGLIRNYSVSLVIDSSISCFDELSGPHSFQTIQVFLSSLASLDLSRFDLIVTGNPNPTVVCSEIGTISALSGKSTIFESLFSILQSPTRNTDLASAIHTAFDLQRMRSTDYANVIFVLTNGLYQIEEQKRIVNTVNQCVLGGINIIGVGIGIYPKGIEKLFPQIVFSPNPYRVMKAIASIYIDTLSSMPDEMDSISFSFLKISEFQSIIKTLIEGQNNPIFKDEKEELNDIPPTLDAFDDMYNREKNIDPCNPFKNPEGKNTELYVENLFKGQKILIVMLWDYTLNMKNEERYVSSEFIENRPENANVCIKDAAYYYGIILDIVKNYEDAINKLTNQSKPGYCDYYATWVFCGPRKKILPEKEANPNLVGQFIDVLIQFWEKGGSIVFWAEGEPLYYQVNLFLEKVRFKDEPDCPSTITKLRLEGEYQGEGFLTGEESNTLENPGTFNRSSLFFEQCQRATLSHNIIKIYEGKTISHAPYNLDLIKPFKPFARDFDGGISSLFYTANLNTGTGDIIIDCGYTKCFTQMESEGTYRYVQNIMGFTARPEIHKRVDRQQPCDWRPKACTFTIDHNAIWRGFQIDKIDPMKLTKRLWAIDCSDSIKKNYNPIYQGELRKIVDKYGRNGTNVFYLWNNETMKLNSISHLEKFLSSLSNQNKDFEGFKFTGTLSEKIADIALEEKDIREHLIIITDGSVSLESIQKSDKRMIDNNIQFQFVSTYIILPDDPSLPPEYKVKPDLSVGAPYSRNCQNETIYIKAENDEEILASLSHEDINALDDIDNINSYEKFIKQYTYLDNAFQALSLGRKDFDPNLITKLESLNDRVHKGLNTEQEEDFTKKYNVLKGMVAGALEKNFSPEDIAAAKKNVYDDSYDKDF